MTNVKSPLFILILGSLLIIPPINAFDLYLGFDTGPCVPTESFDEVMDDEMTYGLSVDYVPSNHLGVRIDYHHHEFQYDAAESATPLEIDTLGVWAVMDYSMPKYFRFFGLIGPTYFYTRHDYGIDWGDDSEDIGWSGGGGLEFYPVSGWGLRFQAVYNSAELGDGSPRASWVNTTFGMSFKF
ncbi:MAG TPA: outer membrane beta-barrel protein [bacterium]|nr:outer membrane beta-barrel protein [bacterium]